MSAVASAVASAGADRAFCEAMLPRVSRTFALCIRLLPEPLRHTVLVAYLLCRVADTIEDADRLAPAEKARLLGGFGGALERPLEPVADLAAAFAAAATDDERLAADADAVLREYARLAPAEREILRPWVQEMCAGMAEFAAGTDAGGDAAAGDASVRVLDSVAALDRYCYYVAGTVGHLLTGLFVLHAPVADPARRARLQALATSFGLGLQLTNIIKDVADDRRRGWSFVPRDLCGEAGVAPEAFLDAEHRAEAGRVMQALAAKARAHLDDAIRYCTLLPNRAIGIRAFCLTSVYFAIRTLARAERDPRLLEAEHKVKISRGAVYRTVAMTFLVAPSDRLVRWYYRRLGRTDAALV